MFDNFGVIFAVCNTGAQHSGAVYGLAGRRHGGGQPFDLTGLQDDVDKLLVIGPLDYKFDGLGAVFREFLVEAILRLAGFVARWQIGLVDAAEADTQQRDGQCEQQGGDADGKPASFAHGPAWHAVPEGFLDWAGAFGLAYRPLVDVVAEHAENSW